MDAVILAAGRGTRMRPLTDTTPKPLLEVSGRPLLAHLLNHVAALQPARVIVVTHYLKEIVHNWLAEHAPEVIAVDQGVADGTARAVACVEPYCTSESLLVINGDNYYCPRDLIELAADDGFHHLGVIASPTPSRYGVVHYQTERSRFVARIEEKPKRLADGTVADVNAGAYLFRREMFDILRDIISTGAAAWEHSRREIPLTDALDAVAAKGCLKAIPLSCWHDMGTPADLAELDRSLRERSGK